MTDPAPPTGEAPTQEAPTGEAPGAVRQGRLSYAVFELGRTHRSRAAALLRGMNLHPGQELLLMQLFDRDGQTQSELLESVGLDHSTVSKSLRRMQEAGLLTREPAPHDRRAMIVHLTPEGRALEAPITAMWHTLEEASVQNLTPTEIETFIALARRIEASVAG
ncbi:MarR family winged helix-turn-helix transcriptional regulator [Streptomyces sp. NBC_00670]|uniref:MarR family winged helix-turn-helix transcriptional regulator n=1 Tax=Streptomyces sp. NBC_00670 TaxID=2975804 RepID=UPI002E3268C0|nr:MarR family winged helix-turn-helix transcriptional regulator [Streptomyces sp. NBC_00670]